MRYEDNERRFRLRKLRYKYDSWLWYNVIYPPLAWILDTLKIMTY